MNRWITQAVVFGVVVSGAAGNLLLDVSLSGAVGQGGSKEADGNDDFRQDTVAFEYMNLCAEAQLDLDSCLVSNTVAALMSMDGPPSDRDASMSMSMSILTMLPTWRSTAMPSPSSSVTTHYPSGVEGTPSPSPSSPSTETSDMPTPVVTSDMPTPVVTSDMPTSESPTMQFTATSDSPTMLTTTTTITPTPYPTGTEEVPTPIPSSPLTPSPTPMLTTDMPTTSVTSDGSTASESPTLLPTTSVTTSESPTLLPITSVTGDGSTASGSPTPLPTTSVTSDGPTTSESPTPLTSMSTTHRHRFLQEDCSAPDMSEHDLRFLMHGAKTQCLDSGISVSEQEFESVVTGLRKILESSCPQQLCEEESHPSGLLLEIMLKDIAKCAQVEPDIDPCIMEEVFGTIMNGEDTGSDADRVRRKLSDTLGGQESSECQQPSLVEVSQFISLLLVEAETECSKQGTNVTPQEIAKATSDLTAIFVAQHCWGSEGCDENHSSNHNGSSNNDTGVREEMHFFNVAIKYVEQCAGFDLNTTNCLVSSTMDTLIGLESAGSAPSDPAHNGNHQGQPPGYRFLQTPEDTSEDSDECIPPELDELTVRFILGESKQQCMSRGLVVSDHEFENTVGNLMDFFGAQSCWASLCEETSSASEMFLTIMFEEVAQCAGAELDFNPCLMHQIFETIVSSDDPSGNFDGVRRKLEQTLGNPGESADPCVGQPNEAELYFVIRSMLAGSQEQCMENGVTFEVGEIEKAGAELFKLFSAQQCWGVSSDCIDHNVDPDSSYLEFFEESAIWMLGQCADVEEISCVFSRSIVVMHGMNHLGWSLDGHSPQHLVQELEASICTPPNVHGYDIEQIASHAKEHCLDSGALVLDDHYDQAIHGLKNLTARPDCWEDLCEQEVKDMIVEEWMHSCALMDLKFLTTPGPFNTSDSVSLDSDRLRCMVEYIASAKWEPHANWACSLPHLGHGVCGSTPTEHGIGKEAYFHCGGETPSPSATPPSATPTSEATPSPSATPSSSTTHLPSSSPSIHFSMSFVYDDSFDWAQIDPEMSLNLSLDQPGDFSMSYGDGNEDEEVHASNAPTVEEEGSSGDTTAEPSTISTEEAGEHKSEISLYIEEVCSLIGELNASISQRCLQPVCDIGLEDAFTNGADDDMPTMMPSPSSSFMTQHPTGTSTDTSDVPTPVVTSDMPTPVVTSDMPTPVVTSYMPTPVVTSDMPTTVETSDMPTPVVTSDMPTSVVTSDMPTSDSPTMQLTTTSASPTAPLTPPPSSPSTSVSPSTSFLPSEVPSVSPSFDTGTKTVITVFVTTTTIVETQASVSSSIELNVELPPEENSNSTVRAAFFEVLQLALTTTLDNDLDPSQNVTSLTVIAYSVNGTRTNITSTPGNRRLQETQGTLQIFWDAVVTATTTVTTVTATTDNVTVVASVSVNGEEIAITNATGANNSEVVEQFAGASVVAAEILESTAQVMQDAIAPTDGGNSTDNSTDTTSAFMSTLATTAQQVVDESNDTSLDGLIDVVNDVEVESIATDPNQTIGTEQQSVITEETETVEEAYYYPSTLPSVAPSTSPSVLPSAGPTVMIPLPTLKPTASPTRPVLTANPSVEQFGLVEVSVEVGVTLEGISVSDLDITVLDEVVNLLESVFADMLPPGATVRLLKVGGFSVTRRLLRFLEDDGLGGVDVKFEITMTQACPSAKCNNLEVDEISETLYQEVKSYFEKNVASGELTTTIQEEAESMGVSELNNVTISASTFGQAKVTVKKAKEGESPVEPTDEDISSSSRHGRGAALSALTGVALIFFSL